MVLVTAFVFTFLAYDRRLTFLALLTLALIGAWITGWFAAGFVYAAVTGILAWRWFFLERLALGERASGEGGTGEV